jgi:hypothetical protein
MSGHRNLDAGMKIASNIVNIGNKVKTKADFCDAGRKSLRQKAPE